MLTVIIDQSGNEIDSFQAESFTDKVFVIIENSSSKVYDVEYSEIVKTVGNNMVDRVRKVHVGFSYEGEIA